MKLNLNPFNLRFFQTILFLLAAVPCGIPYRYQPNPVFPSELAAFIFASLLVLGAVCGTLGYAGYAFVRDVTWLTVIGSLLLGLYTDDGQLLGHIVDGIAEIANLVVV